jgi:hypothetical protein
MTYALELAQALNDRMLKTFESYAEQHAHTLAAALLEKHKELEAAAARITELETLLSGAREALSKMDNGNG